MIAVFVPAVTRYASFLNLNLNIYTTILCVETILYFATRRDQNFCFIFFYKILLHCKFLFDQQKFCYIFKIE